MQLQKAGALHDAATSFHSSRPPLRRRPGGVRACQRCVREQLVRAARPRPPAPPITHRTQTCTSPAATNSRQDGQGDDLDQEQQQEQEDRSRQLSSQRASAGPGSAAASQQEQNLAVRGALGAIRFYKTAISPLLWPACRYQPTCSSYAMDAFSRYGFWRGGVLTAWRLARCAPWGGRGYDPVRWPPPGLEFMFRE